jgi:hypothetical protein
MFWKITIWKTKKYKVYVNILTSLAKVRQFLSFSNEAWFYVIVPQPSFAHSTPNFNSG